jgi:thymidylate kinase
MGAADSAYQPVNDTLEDMVHTRPAEAPAIPAIKEPIRKLFATLEMSRVRYCHWKSNIRLEQTLAGTQDIDLLVDRRDAQVFHAILLEIGFKFAESHAGLGHPGVFHALALDESTAELVDLHAHYQIVSGDSLVKNYRLPIEDLLLSRTRHLHGVKVPAAEVELLLFLLRIALKHVSPIEILKVNLHYRKVSSELVWLRETANLQEAEALLRTWFPSIEPALFQQLSDAISEHDALLRRVVLGWRIAWQLRNLRRLSFLEAVASRLWRTLSFAIDRLKRRRDLVLLTSGAIVTLVGPKGTGKSTIGRELAARLGRHLLVLRIHAGKPPATALSFLPRLFVPIARSLLPHERLAEYEKPERRQRKTYSIVYVLRMALLAYERRKLLFRALRAATSGAIVISDRYPSDVVGAIDSPCFDREASEKSNFRLKRWFMAKELALYRALPKPWLVLRLVAPIETALQRDAGRVKRGGPNAEAVRRRWDLETRAEFATAPTVLIDASGPLDETIRAAMRAVWDVL